MAMNIEQFEGLMSVYQCSIRSMRDTSLFVLTKSMGSQVFINYPQVNETRRHLLRFIVLQEIYVQVVNDIYFHLTSLLCK